MKPWAIIPARHGALRLPGKPLVPLNGRPLVLHVVDRCREADCFQRVVVATDDARIEAVVREAGAEVVRTAVHCPSGMDRVAEAAEALAIPPQGFVVNVQGDEPAVHPESLRTLAGLSSHPMATLVRLLRPEERGMSQVVKVVCDEAMRALYFSRADIPFSRDGVEATTRLAHLGLYGYRADVLAQLAALPPTGLERTESLEQLRALGHGIAIQCALTPHLSVAVDTPADVPLAEAALNVLRAGPGSHTL